MMKLFKPGLLIACILTIISCNNTTDKSRGNNMATSTVLSKELLPAKGAF
jgi:hypothetical protein